jgi:SAM-dependent methyltransferase
MITIPKCLADFGLSINRLYYKQLHRSFYKGKKQHPSWFDHRIDLYYHWPHHLFWMERGVFPRRYMFEGCTVLDLFCGDGFFCHYFYSTIADSIDAIDKDPSAIAHARKWHSHPKIAYRVVDAVKTDFPRSSYDVIVWFEGIDHIAASEYNIVINRIKVALGEEGVLTGSVGIIGEEKQGKVHWEHQNELSSVSELHNLFSRDFDDIQIDVTVYPDLSHGKRKIGYFTVSKPK